MQTRRAFLKPPVLYALAAGLGFGLQAIAPLGLLVSPVLLRVLLALALFSTGAACVAAAVRAFKLADTNVVTTKPVLALVDSGVYGFSRNPIYLGFTLMLLGVGVGAGSWWHLLLGPVALLLVYAVVVRKEEQLLTRVFGAEYEAYCRRVRRWI